MSLPIDIIGTFGHATYKPERFVGIMPKSLVEGAHVPSQSVDGRRVHLPDVVALSSQRIEESFPLNLITRGGISNIDPRVEY